MAKGIIFQTQATSPLGANKNGIWVDSNNNLIVDRNTDPQKNVTESIENLEAGIGVDALVRSFVNSTASTMPKGTVVYTPTSGQIDLADGDDTEVKARFVGITSEEILAGQAGYVAYAGVITGAASGFTHGSYLYIAQTAGTMTDVKPSLVGGFPAGFHVVKVGLVDGNDLILQPEYIGDL